VRVQSRLFTMDVAKRRGGDWLIVELGDRQVAGLLDETDVRALYTALRDTLDDAGGRPVQDRRATDCCTWRRTQPARFYPRPYPPGVTTTAGSNAFDQGSFLARFDWGEAGLDTLSRGADVVVLVDVLSFTTAVDVGVSRGVKCTPATYEMRHPPRSRGSWAPFWPLTAATPHPSSRSRSHHARLPPCRQEPAWYCPHPTALP
jgi:ATP-grasp domain, R2K clade family 3